MVISTVLAVVFRAASPQRWIFAGMAVIVGIAAAVFWRLVVRLPAYVVQPDGSATVSERALTEFFSS